MSRRRLCALVIATLLAAGSVVSPSGAGSAAARPVPAQGQSAPAVAAGVSGAVPPAGADGRAGPVRPAGSGEVVSTRVRPRTGWAWPLAPPVVLARPFDPPDQPWLSGHRGVDLAASVDAAVRAPHAGTVTYSGVIAGRGVVVVTHGDGLRSTFEPVLDAVPAGTAVAAGEQVATVSAVAGHCAPATCLHWGVLSGDRYLDPLAVLGTVRVILLPLP